MMKPCKQMTQKNVTVFVNYRMELRITQVRNKKTGKKTRGISTNVPGAVHQNVKYGKCHGKHIDLNCS